MRRAVSRLVAMGFCTWMCFFASAQHCDGLQTEFREGANVDVIDARMAAEIFEGGNELATVALGEGAGTVGMKIGAGHYFIADVGVRARVFVRDGAGADDADPHVSYCDMTWREFGSVKM